MNHATFHSRLETGSCLDFLPRLPEGCADLVFADPPFGIGYKYDVYDDRTDREAYLRFADRWLCEALRVLAPRGSFFLAIGDEFAAEYKVRLDALGLSMRNWIIWHYTFGPHQRMKFGRDHVHILYYTRPGLSFTFNADAIRVESARQRMGDKRANPLGRVPGDVWTFSRLCGTFRERTKHPCQMPEAVLERIIRAASNPGDLVVDPFAGSGTTLAVAKRLRRKWYGCELSEAYATSVRARLDLVPSSEV